MEEENKVENKENRTKAKGNFTQKIRKNPWVVSTFVLGILVIIFLFSNFSNGITGNVVSEKQAGEILLNYYESNGAEGLSLLSVEEVSGLYQVNFEYKNEIIPVFITKDGKFAGSLNSIITEITETNADSIETQKISVSVDDDAVEGSPSAPVTIVEFSDYQCPFCRKFWTETLPSIKSQYIDTGKIKLIFRDFPLASLHPMAQSSGEAAECVRELGGDNAYFEYHDKMFEEQNILDSGSPNGSVTRTVTYTSSDLKQWASDLGYDIGTCLDSGKMANEVKNDLKDGQNYGVQGTPAFFINGKFVSGAQPFSVFEEIIEEELANA